MRIRRGARATEPVARLLHGSLWRARDDGDGRDAWTSGEPAANRRARTRTEMQNVDMRLGEGIVFHVDHLAGEMIAKEPGGPVILDDKHAYLLRIDTARTAVGFEELSNLLNGHVFAYDGAPLRNLAVSREEDPGEEDRLQIHGSLASLGGVPFEVEGVPELTPAGEIRIRTESIQVLDIGVGGLLDLLGKETEDLVDARRARGIRVEGNDLFLSPARMLPPPETEGRVVRLEVLPDSLVLVFGGSEASGAGVGGSPAAGADDGSGPGADDAPAAGADEGSGNYLLYRGGISRIGRLTMTDTDIRVVDADPEDPFGFDVDRMHPQLNAGWVKLTPDGGLVPHAVDYQDLPSPSER